MDTVQDKFDQSLAEILPVASGLSSKGGPTTFRLLLAVSGGIDSIVMAELFLHSRWKIPFELAHCNFQLRGGDSWSDELFVANWCSHNDIRLHRVTFDTIQYAEEQHLSIEMAARNLRYAWFDQLCNEEGFDAVSIAHNANDNAETLFLNLLRGTGIKGICGMHRTTLLPVPDTKNSLIRPLLSITRAEIEEYAEQHGILFCIDRTNAEIEFKRNRIRHLVFPQLAQINPSFLTTLSEDMQRFGQVDEMADAYFKEHVSEVVSKGDGEAILTIDIKWLKRKWKSSMGQATYFLFHILEPYGFNTSTVTDILQLISSKSTISGKVFHSSDYVLLTSSEKMLLIENQGVDDDLSGDESAGKAPSEKVINNVSEIVDNFSSVLIQGEGAYELNGRKFHFMLMDRIPDLNLRQPEGVVMWDYDCLSFPFILRGWRKGDWFRPLGLHGNKKLSDLFTDMKWNVLQKRQAVIALSVQEEDFKKKENSHIAAVLCSRIDESVKVTDQTSKILVVKEELL